MCHRLRAQAELLTTLFIMTAMLTLTGSGRSFL